MDAVKFLREKNRMCSMYKNCFECLIGNGKGGCQAGIVRDQEVTEEELVSIVEKWADEHPAKTRQSEFLKMFPNAKRNGDYIDICPKIVDVKLVDQCKEYDHYDSCDGCKKYFWRDELTEED